MIIKEMMTKIWNKIIKKVKNVVVMYSYIFIIKKKLY